MPKQRSSSRTKKTKPKINIPISTVFTEIKTKGLKKDEIEDINKLEADFNNIVLQFNYESPGTFTHVEGVSKYFTVHECGGKGDCFFRSIGNDKNFDQGITRLNHINTKLQLALRLTKKDSEKQIDYLRKETSNLISLQLYGKILKKYNDEKTRKGKTSSTPYKERCFNNHEPQDQFIDDNLKYLFTYILNYDVVGGFVNKPGCIPEEISGEIVENLPFEFTETKTNIMDTFALTYLQGQKHTGEQTDLSYIVLVSFAYKINIIVHRSTPWNCSDEELKMDSEEGSNCLDQYIDMFDFIKKISQSEDYRKINELPHKTGASDDRYVLDLKEQTKSSYKETHIYYHDDVNMFERNKDGTEKHYVLLREIEFNSVKDEAIFGNDDNQTIEGGKKKYIISLPMSPGYNELRFDDVLGCAYREDNGSTEASAVFWNKYDNDQIKRPFEAAVQMRIALAKQGMYQLCLELLLYCVVNTIFDTKLSSLF